MSTLEQIQAKLKKLQAQADALIARKAQIAIDQIRELMLKHGLTTADIEARAKARRAANGVNGHAGVGKAKVAAGGQKLAKYRDPKTGATWTGHGRAPGWIAAAKDRNLFLIDGASQSMPSGSILATRAKGKGQPKGAQPPKYRHPTTGATWSGRGPAPAWLASVKDRSKFLIDASAASSAGKAGSVKSSVASGAVSKKAAVKKAVAKKARAGKQTVGSGKAAVKSAAKKAVVRKVSAKKAATKAATKVATKAATKATTKPTTKPTTKAPGRRKAAAPVPATSAAAPLASTAASA